MSTIVDRTNDFYPIDDWYECMKDEGESAGEQRELNDRQNLVMGLWL